MRKKGKFSQNYDHLKNAVLRLMSEYCFLTLLQKSEYCCLAQSNILYKILLNSINKKSIPLLENIKGMQNEVLSQLNHPSDISLQQCPSSLSKMMNKNLIIIMATIKFRLFSQLSQRQETF